ncbi:hypothetical protein MU448_00845 [Streptococcus sp. O1]|uniref:hypothetical protein n=1 Tax=Streptococcus sp. O1 TaxID=2928735 RepID=UPI00211B3242|nr:hypothetical protein [Streptococcus sp. O1]MCQ9213018.1 hypothetical protein [Streptococcus sp. O1]
MTIKDRARQAIMAVLLGLLTDTHQLSISLVVPLPPHTVIKSMETFKVWSFR